MHSATSILFFINFGDSARGRQRWRYGSTSSFHTILLNYFELTATMVTTTTETGIENNTAIKNTDRDMNFFES